jgi:hypothetical protein
MPRPSHKNLLGQEIKRCVRPPACCPPWLPAGLINAYLREHTPALEVLPDTLSWKAYWGGHPGATLLHWLGPKPAHARCMRCYQANKHRGSAWSEACPCTRVPFKSMFQLSPDGGRMYGDALDAFESYLQQDGGAAARSGP